MSSDRTFTTIQLSYPIFDLDPDPYNRPYLVAGGGGGINKNGVPNKLVGYCGLSRFEH